MMVVGGEDGAIKNIYLIIIEINKFKFVIYASSLNLYIIHVKTLRTLFFRLAQKS